MNDDVIQDLKQFIAATVAQQVSDVRADIKNLDEKLNSRIDNLEQNIADAMDTNNDETFTQLKDHEKRITLLEQTA